MTTAKAHELVQDMPASLADSFFSVHRLIAHVCVAHCVPTRPGKVGGGPGIGNADIRAKNCASSRLEPTQG